ncbi:MAG TPA: tetratricopeptide repeat protein [Candidatus Cloacimonas sp.]|nr:tetratricopeptide repeat protein [Candidatus Cloacimonas sp.]
MKKSLFLITIISLSWILLIAIPQPVHIVQVSKEKANSFGVDCFHLQGSVAYCVDNTRGIIKAWDASQNLFLQPVFAKLPYPGKANDITGDETTLYLLDSKASSIYLYGYDGKYLRTISFKGSPDIQFRNAIRILVNYQGFIYVLDAGRNMLFAFTNEGMFLGKVSILAPIAMCLGEDQIIHVLVNKGKNQSMLHFDQNLTPCGGFVFATPENKIDRIPDASINQYNEYYVIYALSTKIGKTDSSGRLFAKSTWGSKATNVSMVSFQQPTAVKTVANNGKVLIGILDSKVRTVKLYLDSEFSTMEVLQKPPYTMRPQLVESKELKTKDYLVQDGKKYYIHHTTVQYNKAKKTTEAIACRVGDNNIFSIYAVAQEKKGVKGFDAIAIYNNKLYAVDSKSCKVFIYNALTGDYIDSFGGKGSQNGQLKMPTGIAIDSEGMVYIADQGNYRIAIFSENSAHMRNIDLRSKMLKPQLLRTDGRNLYFLANNSAIYQIPLSNEKNLQLVASAPKISTFDILYNNSIGYIDGQTQQLNIKNNNRTEQQYFAKNTNGAFPGFTDIYLIRYIPKENNLYICDNMATNTRLLTFYFSPKKPQTIRFIVNQDKQAELSWDAAEGIYNWYVIEKAGNQTQTYKVSEPRFVITEPKPQISTYRVQSISADEKPGPLSEEIEDAYSYYRFLAQSKNYEGAVQALERASKIFTGVNFGEEIVQTYTLEAQMFISQNEFEKALISIGSIEKIVGVRVNTALQKAEIYRMMGDYKQGIAYLENFKRTDDQSIMRELIALYYMDKNYAKVKELCNSYLTKFSDDKDVIRYSAYSEENLGNYANALSAMRQLIALENNLDNEIKLGELLMLNRDYVAARNSLQRTLLRADNQSADVIQKLIGDCYFAEGKYADAIDKYNDALQLNPNEAEYYYCLGKAYEKNRKSSEATNNFASAYQIMPKEVKYGFAYAQALDKEMHSSEALAVMDNIYQYIAADSTTTAYHVFYHDLLMKGNRYDEAWKVINIALEYAPDDKLIQDKVMTTSETRKFYNEKRDEIEIKKLEFYKVFPALSEYYKTHPLGTVTLYNTRNISIENITVNVTIPQITDKPFNIVIPAIMGGTEQQIDIKLPINQRIFDLCKNGAANFNVEVQVEWQFAQRHGVINKSDVIHAQGINAMDWNDRKQYACFVNPADENLRNFVTTKITQLFKSQPSGEMNKNIQRAVQVWSFYSANGIRYISDMSSSNIAGSQIDNVQYPFQTLIQKAGDCDDLLALLASSLSVIGVECGFVDIQEHVMLVINTGITTEEIFAYGFSPSQFIYKNRKYWLPIETTLLGKETFTNSWKEASKRYNLLIEKGIDLQLIEFASAHQLYPPAPYTEIISSYEYGNREQAISKYEEEIESIKLMGKVAQEEEFIATLKKYPNNLIVANKYALWCVKNERLGKAAELWTYILNQDPDNHSALINLGNLQLNNKNYEAARANYLKAMEHNQDLDLILRNLCILEYQCSNLYQAREYFNRMSDKNLLRSVNQQIYSDLLLYTGE